MKLTPKMWRALCDAADHGDVGHSIPSGRSHAGGFSGTITALRARGLIRGCEITEEGRRVVNDGRAAIRTTAAALARARWGPRRRARA